MDFRVVPGAVNTIKVINDTGAPLLTDEQAALDMIATARHVHGADRLIIDKADVDEAFFDLKTRIAGEVLQKFVNYSMALAIVGDFGGYTSKSLKDFIYESNKGRTVLFVGSAEDAVAKWGR